LVVAYLESRQARRTEEAEMSDIKQWLREATGDYSAWGKRLGYAVLDEIERLEARVADAERLLRRLNDCRMIVDGREAGWRISAGDAAPDALNKLLPDVRAYLAKREAE
jgi:hypothetical protein